jgi:hypothetical protein
LQEALIIGLMLACARKHGRAIERIDTGIAPGETLRINTMAQILQLKRSLFARFIAANQGPKDRDHRRQNRNDNFDMIVEPCQHVLNPSDGPSLPGDASARGEAERKEAR